MISRRASAVGGTRTLPLQGAVAIRLLPAALAAVATVLIGLPTLNLPLHMDQALYVMVGRAVAQGGFPYVDAWDFKAPALYFIYAAAIQGPFGLIRNVRVFDLAWMAVSAALIVELGRFWWNWRAGLIAGLIYALAWSSAIPWWQSGQPDSFVVLPLVLSLLFYEAARGRRGHLIVAGLLLGFAFQLRFNIAFLIPFYPLVELADAAPQKRLKLWFDRMIWMGIGFVAFQAALAVYLAIGSAFWEYVDTMRYASGYTRQGGPGNTAEGPTIRSYLDALRLAFWNWGLARIVVTLPALAGGFYGAAILRDRRIQQLVLFALLVYAGIAIQAKFFWYHYGYLVPILALIGGWTWDGLWSTLRQHYAPALALAIIGVTAGGLLFGSPEVWDSTERTWRAYIRHYQEGESLEDSYATWSGYSAEKTVGQYVNERTQPGESIYVWGFDPQIYLLADRPAASRFLLSFPLMSDWAPDRWQQTFVEELEANRPAYVVVQRGQPGTWIVGHNIDMAEYIALFPAFQQWLDTNCEFEGEVIANIMYRCRR